MTLSEEKRQSQLSDQNKKEVEVNDVISTLEISTCGIVDLWISHLCLLLKLVATSVTFKTISSRIKHKHYLPELPKD